MYNVKVFYQNSTIQSFGCLIEMGEPHVFFPLLMSKTDEKMCGQPSVPPKTNSSISSILIAHQGQLFLEPDGHYM